MCIRDRQNPFDAQAQLPNNNRIANSNPISTSTVTPGGGTRPENLLPAAIVPTKTTLPRPASNMAAGIGAMASPVLTPAVAVVRAPKAVGPAPHPLDQAVEIAHSSLALMRSSVMDYTAILAKREAINGVLGSPAYICLLYTSPSPRDATLSRMPSSA